MAGEALLDSSGNLLLDSSGGAELKNGTGNICCCGSKTPLYQARYCQSGNLVELYVPATHYAFPGTFYFKFAGTCFSVSSADGPYTGRAPVVTGETAIANCFAAGCPTKCNNCSNGAGSQTPSSITATVSGLSADNGVYVARSRGGGSGTIPFAAQYLGTGGNGTYTLLPDANYGNTSNCNICLYSCSISDTAGSLRQGPYDDFCGTPPVSIPNGVTCGGLSVALGGWTSSGGVSSGVLLATMAVRTPFVDFMQLNAVGTYTDCMASASLSNKIATTGFVAIDTLFGHTFSCDDAAVLVCVGSCTTHLNYITPSNNDWTCPGTASCGPQGAFVFAGASGGSISLTMNP